MSNDLFSNILRISNRHLSNTNINNNNNLLVSILNITSDVITEYSDKNDVLSDTIKNTITLATNMINEMDKDDIIVNDEKDNIDLTVEKKDIIVFENDSIIGNYDYTLDINTIHDHILKSYYNSKSLNIEKYEEELNIINEQLRKKLYKNERLTLEKKKSEILELINNLHNNINIDKYIESSKDLLIEFNSYGKIINHFDFNDDSQFNVNQIDINSIILIINDYINMAKEFFNIKLNYIPSNLIYCPECGYILKNSDFNNDICDNCGVEYKIESQFNKQNIEYKYSNHSNYIYTHDYNFSKFINRLLCINNDSINNNIINTIKNYFDTIYINDNITCDDICNMPMDKDGRRGNYKIKDIYNVLSKLKLSSHDPDVNYIAHMIWNWSLPDKSIYDKVMDDRKIVNDIYQSIKNKYNQDSNMNNWYLSFRLFQKHNLQPCNPHDYKLFKTQKTLSKYEDIWKEICTIAGFDIPIEIDMNSIY